MYEEYFGFAEKPFGMTPDPRYMYQSECHRSALEVLEYAIRRREGLMLVTGDTGTGKTTLCRSLLERANRDTFTSLVLNPFLSHAELLRRILLDFGVVSRGELRTGRLAEVSAQELLDTLRDFLLTLLPLGATALVVIDEAQNLPPAALEQIRMLSNLETDREKLLQIVLVGHVNLQDRLRHPKLRQLDQRVAIRHRLDRISRDELVGYVSHRLSIAGSASVVRFTPRSLDVVHRASGGVPRVVNQVCDRALLGAYASRSTRVSPELVQQAAASLELGTHGRSLGQLARTPSWRAAAAAAAVVVAMAGATVAYRAIVPANGVWDGVSSDLVAMSGLGPDTMLTPSEAPPVLAATSEQAVAHTRLAQASSAPPPSSAPSRSAGGPRPYSVLIGSFRMDDPEFAVRLGELEALGFRAYEIELDLGEGGRLRQLLVGAYANVSDAVRDEARLQQTPRFATARLIVSTTMPATMP